MSSKTVTFLYLQQEDVKRCGGLDMAATIASVEKAFSLLDRGEVQEYHATPIKWGETTAGRRVALHPSYVGGDVDVVGIKWIPSNPENPVKLGLPRSNAFTILTNPHTGYPLAILEGKIISDMRTGAVAGVGAKYLAPPGARVVGLIGGGPINRTHLMALFHTLPDLAEVKIFDIVPEHARRYVDDMARRLNVPASLFRIVDSAEAAVRGSDVVACATNVSYKESYIPFAWVKKGALLINTSVNDFLPEVFQKADRVVVDSHHQFTAGHTTLSQVLKQDLVKAEDIVEIGAVINGKHEGRRSASETILFSPLGMGMNDLINAKRVYENARAQGVGVTLKLWDEPEWF